MGPREVSLELPVGADFMKFGFKKKKICSTYTSTPLIQKHELLMSIVCIYVHSQQQEEKPVYLCTMA